MRKQMVVLGLISLAASALALQVSVGFALSVLALFAIGMVRSHLRHANVAASSRPPLAEPNVLPVTGVPQEPEGPEKSNSPQVVKRPAWVWVICIGFGVSWLWTIFLVYLSWNGHLPLTPALKLYTTGLTVVDLGLFVVVAAISLGAVVLLFMLRKQCVPLFGILFASRIILPVWFAATKGSSTVATDGARTFTNWLVAIVVSFAIFLYARELRETGVLR